MSLDRIRECIKTFFFFFQKIKKKYCYYFYVVIIWTQRRLKSKRNDKYTWTFWVLGSTGEHLGCVFIIDIIDWKVNKLVALFPFIIGWGNCLCKFNPYTEILIRISHMISCRVSVLLFCWEGFFLGMCNILPSGSVLEIDLSEAMSKPVTAVSSRCTFVWIPVPATRHPLCFRVVLSPCLNKKRIMKSVFIFSDSSGKNVL